MRTWRVGSFSMGGALVFLGIFLLLQQFFGWDPAIILLSWWPVLLIILGVEILVYLSFSRKEDSFVKYDFLSIIFIGVIGSVGIGMAILQSVGLLDLANRVVSAEVRIVDLPKYEETQLEGIKRIKLETGAYPITIEGTDEREVAIFGTYRGDVVGKQSMITEVSDYLFIEKHGDTIFIKFKNLPQKHVYNYSGNLEAVLLIPKNVQLDVNGYSRNLTINPRGLESEWTITHHGLIEIETLEEENLTIKAEQITNIEETEWDQVEDGNNSAIKTIGNGDHLLFVRQADHVTIRTE